jgi:hypothetical protein
MLIQFPLKSERENHMFRMATICNMKKHFIRELLTFSVTNIVLFVLLSRAAEAPASKKVFPAICSAIFAFLLIMIERLRRRVNELEIKELPPTANKTQ